MSAGVFYFEPPCLKYIKTRILDIYKRGTHYRDICVILFVVFTTSPALDDYLKHFFSFHSTRLANV